MKAHGTWRRQATGCHWHDSEPELLCPGPRPCAGPFGPGAGIASFPDVTITSLTVSDGPRVKLGCGRVAVSVFTIILGHRPAGLAFKSQVGLLPGGPAKPEAPESESVTVSKSRLPVAEAVTVGSESVTAVTVIIL